MNKKIWIAVMSCLAGPAVAGEALPVIDVEAALPVDATSATITEKTSRRPTPSDGGEWILDVPGVSGIRMGAKGVDPVIRGQKYNQLNVLLGGAFIYGGCPNRMDPPTSYADAAGYDAVTVIKGVQSLLYGSGGSGGTVLFERSEPVFEAGRTFSGRAGGGYQSNGEDWDTFLDLAGGSKRAFARGIVSASEARPYQDGDGNEVHSGYKKRTGALTLGKRMAGGTLFRLDTDVNRGRDTLYAGAPMDAPTENSNVYKLRMDMPTAGPFENLRAEIYRSDVDHVMDNYSLRPAGMMWMRVDANSKTGGCRLLGDLGVGEGVLTLGLDVQNNDRDATRYSSMTATVPTATQSFLWPGTELRQTGLIAEYNGDLGKASHYTVSLRFDRVEAEATKADLAPAAMMTQSANGLYRQYYGSTAQKQTENNLGALLRMEHDLDPHTTFFWGLSRTVRTADASERFMAGNNSNSAKRWIGNPDLDPEIHYQFDVGTNRRWSKTTLSISAYYDSVHDYILRDRAHGQAGILQNDNAAIYRNVNARLYGFDAEAVQQWSAHWRSRFTLAYVNATNTTDDRPIAQTPPPEGTASLDYKKQNWLLGMRVRATMKQTRVEDNPLLNSGLDAGQTPGFAVWNVYGHWEAARNTEVKFGIDNLFDRLYAEHLNKPNAYDPGANQVNAPGRSYWVRLRVKF